MLGGLAVPHSGQQQGSKGRLAVGLVETQEALLVLVLLVLVTRGKVGLLQLGAGMQGRVERVLCVLLLQVRVVLGRGVQDVTSLLLCGQVGCGVGVSRGVRLMLPWEEMRLALGCRVLALCATLLLV